MKKFLIVLGILLSGIVAYLGYMGLFQDMKVSESSFGPYHLVYKEHIGPYPEVKKIFEEMQEYKKKGKFDTEMAFGIYYDDPGKVEKSKLRSEIGFVLNEEESKKLQGENPENDIKFKLLSPRRYFYTTFPYKNMGSFFLGVIKAYPALEKYGDTKNYNENEPDEATSKNYYAMELYKKDKIFYMLTSP